MNETIKEYYGYMDAMLKYFESMPDSPPLLPDDIAEKAGLKIDKPIAFLMCAKMSREGYLQRFESLKYSLFAEGLFFIKSGGYKKQYEDAVFNERRVSLLESRQAQTEHRLYLINLVIAIATGGLLLLELIKWIVSRLDLVWCK